MSGKRRLDVHAAEIARLYAEGRSQDEIARIYGAHQTSIHLLMRRHGIAARPAVAPSGPKSAEWKGDCASYEAFHMRVYKLRGKPSRCERCDLDDPSRRYEWANLTGNYADPDDYERMCVPCHRRFDNARRRAAS